MATQQIQGSLQQKASLLAMANRQKLLNKESERRIVKDAVREVLKEL